MEFTLEQQPPTMEMIDNERKVLVEEMGRISRRDTLISIILITVVSLLLGVTVYWTSDSYRYAGFAMALFPVLGVVFSLTGVTKAYGFRSAAVRLSELKNALISLNAVIEDNSGDMESLCRRHKLLSDYHESVLAQGRTPVNAELAMYWDFDGSTQAKTARGREFLERARGSVLVHQDR